jgi:hypothetical protein
MTNNNRVTGRSTAKQKRKLKQIVLDCNIRRYTNDETLGYIQTTTGKNMTLRNLLYIKAEIKEDAGAWLDGLAYTKNEYVATYKERIDEILSYQKALQELYKQSLHEKDSSLSLHIVKELHALSITLTHFYNAGPLINALKGRIEKAIEHQEKKEEEGQGQVNNNCNSNNNSNISYNINSDDEDNSNTEQKERQEQEQEQPQQSSVDDWVLTTAIDMHEQE